MASEKGGQATANLEPTVIVAIWTRKIDGPVRFGRVNVAVHVRNALHEAGSLANRTLSNVLEGGRTASALLDVVKSLTMGWLSARPLPLQCALFAASANRILATVDWQGAGVIYLDGIRTLLLLRGLRKTTSGIRIVVDLDDLMSRRFDFAYRNNLPLSLGNIEHLLPAKLVRLISGKIARSIVLYERFALRQAEREVLLLADTVVLLNQVEAEMLRADALAAGGQFKAEIVTIPPPMDRRVESMPDKASFSRGLWRAVFVGSDVYVQNRMTISYLLDLWLRYEIETQLHIYGKQTGWWPSVTNVTFHGYVDDIAEAYGDRSFVVYHCLVPGGIKTKVLEAFGHATPVVANNLAFEGILPPGYPLIIDDEAELVAFLKEPGSRERELIEAVDATLAYLEQEHSTQVFSKRWKGVIRGTSDSS